MDLREQDRLHSPRPQRPESKIKFRRICRFKKVIVVEAGVGLIAKVRMLSGRGAVGPPRLQHTSPVAAIRLFLFTAERLDDDNGFRESGP